MTNKYLNIRREIYEKDLKAGMQYKRSFSDIIKVFRPKFWVLFSLFIISMISTVVLSIERSIWMFLSLVIYLILYAIPFNILREKHIYDKDNLEKELKLINYNYNKCINEAWEILNKHGINTYAKINCLKNECIERLKKNENPIIKAIKNIFNMFIGVPIGIFINSVIDEKISLLPARIIAIVLLGVFLLFLIKLIYIIIYYLEGYFKDKYLLDVLCEFDYFDFENFKKER